MARTFYNVAPTPVDFFKVRAIQNVHLRRDKEAPAMGGSGRKARATARLAPQICPSPREPVSGSTLAAAHIIPTYPALPQMVLLISLPTLGSVWRWGRPRPAH